uniref:Uncharacterized protein n=1 Tax=Ovis aries TaxID=9940 RepID=A0AC11CD82_SHEEP
MLFNKIPGEWRTIYTAADNKDKIVEGGPLRNYYRRIECIDDCESLSITFYLKDDGTCLLLTEVAKRKEGYVYVIEYKYSSFSDGLSSQNHATCSVG